MKHIFWNENVKTLAIRQRLTVGLCSLLLNSLVFVLPIYKAIQNQRWSLLQYSICSLCCHLVVQRFAFWCAAPVFSRLFLICHKVCGSTWISLPELSDGLQCFCFWLSLSVGHSRTLVRSGSASHGLRTLLYYKWCCCKLEWFEVCRRKALSDIDLKKAD